MNPLLVELGFRRRAPWLTQFVIAGRTYGGDVDFSHDARLTAFRSAFPEARTILDLGALEGGHSIELARAAEHVVAVDGRRSNVERARFACRALGVRNVDVVHADLEVTGPDACGAFDAVFCCALLHHLTRPMALVDRLRRAAPCVYLWTHVTAEPAPTTHAIDGTPGAWHDERYDVDEGVGLGPRSFWPTLASVVDHLRQHGFTTVDVTEEPHPAGPAAAIVARA